MVLVALVMEIGGMISSGKIAETISHKMPPMTEQQALLASLITSGLVIGALNSWTYRFHYPCFCRSLGRDGFCKWKFKLSGDSPDIMGLGAYVVVGCCHGNHRQLFDELDILRLQW